MTTTTIILITWFIAGLLSNIIIAMDLKEDIILKDIPVMVMIFVIGYFSLFIVLITIALDNITLPKIKLPKSDKILWRYPKKKQL